MDGYIYLYAQGRDRSLSYSTVRASKHDGYEQAKLRLPAEVGTYRLTFEGRKKELYAETSIEAVAASITLNAPTTVSAGSQVPVALEGPDGLAGYVYLYAEGRERSIHYASVRENQSRGGYQPMKLKVPVTAGTYLLKFETSSKEVLAETSFEALAVQTSLEHEPNRPAATFVRVTPQGPSGLDGYIYLHALGRDRSITYAQIAEAASGGYSNLNVKLPARPGEY